MLELIKIHKDYPAGDGTVNALKGVSIQFRENEFVSILGPSGCGKTTLLNIIGGLDQYSQGDLIINGRSTKDYRDRDWDTYRNHSVGFVFQSYNLIPHQTVLQNVELALTLSGVSKSERRKRAIKALEDVGLGTQLRKKPGQMSGGQMQRVAIARALVNDPDIILADEPTGALDTETSVQVMEILKKVAQNRLVVMVTHNPDLAEKYSTRIIRMLDGEIIGDTRPMTDDEEVRCREKDKKQLKQTGKARKPAMSLATSFGLSFKNLVSKKGRTMLTSFAGSIGIIGIALIFAVSQGMTAYINAVQEDTLSSYPLTIQQTHMDMSSMLSSFMETAKSGQEHDRDAVYTKPLIYDMINAMNSIDTTENDLTSFREFLENERKNPDGEYGLYDALNGVQYGYDLDLQIYTKNIDGDIICSDTTTLMKKMMAEYIGMDTESVSSMTQMAQSSPLMSMLSATGGGNSLWQEMLPGEDGKLVSDLLEKQYDLVYGSWPNQYNEVVLVVDSNNELDDLTLYALGLKSDEEISAIMQAVGDKTVLEADTGSWSYQEICDMEFRTILPSDCYYFDEAAGVYMDLRTTDAGLRYLYDNATVLKVTGIIRPSEEAVSTMLTGSIGYTSELTRHVIEAAKDTEAVKAQLADPTTDIFTGLPFEDNTGAISSADKETAFRDYIQQLDTDEKAAVYIRMMSIPSEQQMEEMVAQTMVTMTREDMEMAMIQAMTTQMGVSQETVTSYVTAMSDEEITELFSELVAEQVKLQYAAQVEAQLGTMQPQQLVAALDMAMEAYTTEECAGFYDSILEFSDSSYEDNLIELGCVELDSPATISLYASTFESKDVIEEAIAAYNDGTDELHQIKYTDYVGLMMSSVTSIIDAITYVLIAFVAISLVVSSIMIGVITLISVQERTKEIGILRAIGASKKNVSSMFNMETIIIGFSSGTIGVLVTYLLCIPINAIIRTLTGIPNLNAYLPWQVALILIGISMLLTVFSGLIPARSAARKDPVVALRTE